LVVRAERLELPERQIAPARARIEELRTRRAEAAEREKQQAEARAAKEVEKQASKAEAAEARKKAEQDRQASRAAEDQAKAEAVAAAAQADQDAKQKAAEAALAAEAARKERELQLRQEVEAKLIRLRGELKEVLGFELTKVTQRDASQQQRICAKPRLLVEIKTLEKKLGVEHQEVVLTPPPSVQDEEDKAPEPPAVSASGDGDSDAESNIRNRKAVKTKRLVKPAAPPKKERKKEVAAVEETVRRGPSFASWFQGKKKSCTMCLRRRKRSFESSWRFLKNIFS